MAHSRQPYLRDRLAHYSEILERAAGSVIVYAFLGREYATIGMREEAIRSYGAFLEKWQGDPEHLEVIKTNIQKLRRAEKTQDR